MSETITVDDLRQRLDSVLRDVQAGGRSVSIEDRGETVAVLVNAELFDELVRAWSVELVHEVRNERRTRADSASGTGAEARR